MPTERSSAHNTLRVKHTPGIHTFTPVLLIEWDLSLFIGSAQQDPQALDPSLCLEADTFVYIGMYTVNSC